MKLLLITLVTLSLTLASCSETMKYDNSSSSNVDKEIYTEDSEPDILVISDSDGEIEVEITNIASENNQASSKILKLFESPRFKQLSDDDKLKKLEELTDKLQELGDIKEDTLVIRDNTVNFEDNEGVGYSIPIPSNTDKNNTKPSRYMDEDIILISRYMNYAWGKQDNGYFLTRNGDIYEFSASGDKYSDISLDEVLTKIKNETEPIKSIEEDKVNKIIESIQNIDITFDIYLKHTAMDAGSDMIYVVDLDRQTYIVLKESGDFTGEREDEASQEIIAIAQDIF